MNQDLNNRQLKALPALIASPTIKEGCKKAGVSVKQYYEWLKNPIFRERLEQEQKGICEKTLSSLEESITAAFQTLRTLLQSKNENVQVRSADSLLNFGLRLKELQQIENRLNAIEEMVLNRTN